MLNRKPNAADMIAKIFFENGDYNIDHSSPVILLKDGKYIAKISHRDDIKQSIKLKN